MISETISLFHMLHAVTNEIHESVGMTAPLRGVMNSLLKHGPKTVPQLARMRPVSRQHIQQIVNSLLEKSLVEYSDNPDHKRSKLIQLTKRGETLVAGMADREERILRKVPIDLDPKTLRNTVDALRRLHDVFAGGEVREIIVKEH